MILVMLGVLLPHLSLAPLFQAGFQLFGRAMGTFYSLIGGSLGILFLLFTVRCFIAGYDIIKNRLMAWFP